MKNSKCPKFKSILRRQIQEITHVKREKNEMQFSVFKGGCLALEDVWGGGCSDFPT